MKYIILGLMLSFVGCNQSARGKVTPFKVGDIIVIKTDGEKCSVIDVDPQTNSDIKVRCPKSGTGWTNSVHYKRYEEEMAVKEVVKTEIPMQMFQLKCQVNGKETSLERELKFDISKFDGWEEGETCELKIVRLKYE